MRMSTPSALKIVAAPINNLKPRSLVLSGAGIIPLGFVAQDNGTVVVKWSSPLDPDNPNESLPVKTGRQYTCQIDTIISSDVDLLLFFGDTDAGGVHLGGGSSPSNGGGSDASAANQTLALNALDSIYDALQLVGTEATSVQIRDAVTGLGNGATLSDLATALTPLATETTVAQIRDALASVSTELTSQAILAALGPLASSLDVQAVQSAITDLGDGSTIDDVVTALTPLATAAKQDDILTALQAQGLDIASIKTSIDLLVPDLDAVRVAVEATNAKIPASPAQDRTTAAAPSATRASNGTSFIDLALDTTVALVKTAVEAVRDRLPDAFGAGGGVKIDGSGTALPVSGTVTANLGSAIPAGSNTIGKTDQGASAAVGGAWAMRVANAGASAFVTPFISGDSVTQSGAWNITNITGTVSLPTGAAQDRTVANAPFATRASNGTSFIDLVLDATVVASNALLTAIRDRLPGTLISGRIDANIGAWLGSIAPTVGQKTMANSVPVAIASDNGLSTAAKQPALGIAGTASTDVLTVQGIAGGVGLPVDTELPTAASLSDVMANPTAPAVGAWMIGVNPGTGQGNRMPGISTTGFFVQGATNAGSAVSQRPVTVGGVDGSTNVRNFLVDASGRLVTVGAAASGAAVAGNPLLLGGSDGTNARTIATDTLGRPNINIVSPLGIQAPSTSVGVVAAKGLRPANTDTTPAASAARVLVAGPGRLVELHYRYTGAGTKYIVLLDQATLPGVAANWIGWYDNLTNGSGREIFEFLTPIDFVNGITVAVTATEPIAGTPIVLSTNAAEFFSVPFFQYQ